ncbi:S9 family peptidase [Persicimonas caeni]|uniref:S9 family peptidase n=1 Tax=Persicimonas caeni TaxID=2292766 RepID=A0A4Y6PRC7_PERCE|nr:S9 family peptidase [Persicimonas caeni]QDG50866.1 S9 family peptidase [Persicimonas caeni]QED32087.1 S9 family peptidase [Persicimonas caeni]
MKTKKPYGLWSSGLSAKAMAGDLGLKDVGWTSDGTLVWLESRDGHGVLVAKGDEAARDLTREQRVSGGVGYGGGEFCVHGRSVYFAASDGRLYRVGLDTGNPRALTPAHGSVASPVVSPDGDWVVYVHTDGHNDVLAAVDSAGDQWPIKLVSGDDFYMQPQWSPDGRHLAWVSWNHPNMPWDETELHVGTLKLGENGLFVIGTERVAGGESVSVMQPEFSPDGQKLAYLSDRDGWWHLYVHDTETGEVEQLTEGNFEVGGPAWIQGIRAYIWKPDSSGLYAIRNEKGEMDLLEVSLDGASETVSGLSEYTFLGQLAMSPDGTLGMIASSSRIPTRVVTWSPDEPARVARRSSAERLEADQLSEMEPVSWTAQSGGESVEIYGNYYPPTNPRFEADGKPPALVMIHGGPTSQRTARFEAANQFFATRGFAVLDVNYRGSTGYGREYRDALAGQWGIFDVEDAVSGANFLINGGLADAERIVIMGGSAGGYTVLQSLVSHPGTFAAGISKYGISNLFALSMETHKFESHYNDMLVGELPEASETFRERSPLFNADRIEDPVAIFQGGKDKVVPQNQAEAMVETLAARGVPHEYHIYEEEGHGWRRSETIEHFYGAVMDFLKKYVIFK